VSSEGRERGKVEGERRVEMLRGREACQEKWEGGVELRPWWWFAVLKRVERKEGEKEGEVRKGVLDELVRTATEHRWGEWSRILISLGVPENA